MRKMIFSALAVAAWRWFSKPKSRAGKTRAGAANRSTEARRKATANAKR